MNALSASEVNKMKKPLRRVLTSFHCSHFFEREKRAKQHLYLNTGRIWGIIHCKSLFVSWVGLAKSCTESLLLQSMKGHCVRAVFLFTQLHVNNSQEAGALLDCFQLLSTPQEAVIT